MKFVCVAYFKKIYNNLCSRSVPVEKNKAGLFLRLSDGLSLSLHLDKEDQLVDEHTNTHTHDFLLHIIVPEGYGCFPLLPLMFVNLY